MKSLKSTRLDSQQRFVLGELLHGTIEQQVCTQTALFFGVLYLFGTFWDEFSEFFGPG